MEKVYEANNRRRLGSISNQLLNTKVLDVDNYDDGFMILELCGNSYFECLKYQSVNLATYAVLMNSYNAKYVVDDIRDVVLENIILKVKDVSKFNTSEFFWMDIYDYLSEELQEKYKLDLLERLNGRCNTMHINMDEFRKAVKTIYSKDNKSLDVILDFKLNEEAIVLIIENNIHLRDTIILDNDLPDGIFIKLIINQLKNHSYRFLISDNLYDHILIKNVFNKLDTEDKMKLIWHNYKYLFLLNQNEITDDEYIQIIKDMDYMERQSFIEDLKNGKADKFNNHKLLLALFNDYSPHIFGDDVVKKYAPEIEKHKIGRYEVYTLVEDGCVYFTNSDFYAYHCTLQQLIDRLKYYVIDTALVEVNELEDYEIDFIKELENKFGGNKNE